MRNSRAHLFPFQPFILLAVLFLAALGQAFLSQNQAPWTLAPGLLLYAGALYLFLWSPKPAPSLKENQLTPLTEGTALLLLSALALFFHLFRLNQIPPGMATEVTCGPYLGYALPPSQWAPFCTGGLSLTHPDIPTWAYPWFHLFTPSHLTYGLFYAFLSLLAPPVGYLFFRRLAGAGTALVTLFLFIIMQWPLTLGRNGHPSVTVPLYALGALLFARGAWKSNTRLSWILCGLFCGLGFCCYPAGRAILLLVLVVFFWEYLNRPTKGKRTFPLEGILLFALANLAAAVPCLETLGRTQSWLTGSPGEDLFVGSQALAQKSLKPLWDNFWKVALVFNRTGSPSPMESLPGRPLLDDATGLLFVLGLGLALTRLKEAKYFYGLAGALILSFPALFSTEPLHARRMAGMAPFIAYLAALAAAEVLKRAGPARDWRKLVLSVLFLMETVAVGENFKTYFWDRAQDETCWLSSEVDAFQAGQAIAQQGDAYEYYLSPAFYGRFQVLFLGHAERDHMHSLDLPGDFGYLAPPPGRGLCFVIQQGRTGVLSALQKRWLGGVTQKFLDPWGRPCLYILWVPPSNCAPRYFTPLPQRRYWECSYRDSLAPGAKPILTVRDPVLNFSYRDDFPVKNAGWLWVEWHGTLHPPKAGKYWFLISTSDQDHAQMNLSGKPLAVSNEDAQVTLEARDYPVVIYLMKLGGFDSVFHLVWKPPGSEKYEVVPPEVMR